MQQDERQASGNDEDINLTCFVQLLPLGEENYNDKAKARRADIVQLSNFLKTIGDRIEFEDRKYCSNLKEEVNVESSGRSFFGSVTKTIDVVLTWLENSSKQVEENKDYKKNECVLRGLLHYAVIGSYAALFPLLKIICKSLDVPENPYKSISKDIKANLAKVETQHKEVCILLEKAGDILKEMIVEVAFDLKKALQFDYCVKDATVFLEESKGYLKLAQKSTSELIEVMTIMKWFSRIVRLGGWALTCFALYQLKPSFLDKLQDVVSADHLEIINKCFSDNHMDKVTFVTLCATSFYAWISLYPSRAYELLDNLNDMKKEHGRLEMKQHNLQKRLVGKKEEIDGLKKKKTTL